MIALQIFAEVMITMLIPLLLFQIGPEWFVLSSMVLIGWNTFAKITWHNFAKQLVESIREDAGFYPPDEREENDDDSKK